MSTDPNIVMHHLIMACILRNVSLGDLVIVQTSRECTYTNVDAIVFTHLGYTVEPIAPRLEICTSCCCTEYDRQL